MGKFNLKDQLAGIAALIAAIVAIGGGTGLASLLQGLKRYSSRITAIVTVADDGGSSGILRRELGVQPPGDIRNCLAALSTEEPLLSKLFAVFLFSTLVTEINRS